jgi:hypothetical protein
LFLSHENKYIVANFVVGIFIRFYGRKNWDIYYDLISEGFQRIIFRQSNIFFKIIPLPEN